MASDEKRRAERKRMRARKRAARKTAIISLIIAVALFGLIVLGIQKAPGYLLKTAESAIQSGNTARARFVIGLFSASDQTALMLNQCDYQDAQALYDAGEYERAEAAFSALGNYEDSMSMVRACAYARAQALYESGQLEAARDAFSALTGYLDAQSKRDDCVYAMAETALQAGDDIGAMELFLSVSAHRDAHTRAGDIAMKLTGLTDPDLALSSVSALSEEELATRARLTEAREKLKSGTVAVGFYHTVAVTEDGRVLAAGLNADGQTDVTDWTDIVQVAAGAYHTVGLKADGTVVAAGRSDSGQTAVSDWTNIIAVAASDYNTVGLKADGSVVSCGFQAYDFLKSVSNAARVAAGSYVCGCVQTDGGILLSHSSAKIENAKEIVDLAVSTALAVAVRADGGVVCSFREFPDWRNIVSVSASGTVILAIDETGRLYAYFMRSSDQMDINIESGAVCAAAGGTHSVVRMDDGTLRGFGDNEYGQLDIADWKLK